MHIKKERSCVACRNAKLQNEMLRIARVGSEYFIDEQKKLHGRGAYVCKENKCIQLTIKKRLLNRAFKSDVGMLIYQKLGEYEQNY